MIADEWVPTGVVLITCAQSHPHNISILMPLQISYMLCTCQIAYKNIYNNAQIFTYLSCTYSEIKLMQRVDKFSRLATVTPIDVVYVLLNVMTFPVSHMMQCIMCYVVLFSLEKRLVFVALLVVALLLKAICVM